MDKFAAHLGAETLEVKPGYARARLKMRDHFLNGLDLAHGGVIFSLADYTSALAANADTCLGVTVNADIHFIKPAGAGDEILAEVREISRSRRLGTYHGTVSDQDGAILAQFQSMVYFKTVK
ncbi:MAG: Acyl-coenzyme A thioesterase PaaI [Candidatus Omnitrophica bacterium ADurb.Bin292]|jgi:acyl-CoA thioesterase|nr:MAG: Acyl-coenzyme A thioesterase PaaI [Candidatus Omnitrophica bacterium ADurb.Bin292]HOE69247.1 PaaI family thioesterase [Candidatus Omnitrophota bacterium]